MTDPQTLQDAVERHLRDYPRPSDRRYQCVVIVENIGAYYASVMLVLSSLRVGGFPGSNAAGVDERVFFATNASCALTRRFAEAATTEVGISTPEIQVCDRRSMWECGYPHATIPEPWREP